MKRLRAKPVPSNKAGKPNRKRKAPMSNTERQRIFKARMIEQGFVQANFWVPASALGELKRACELLRANPDLDVARLVSKKTGKLCGLKRDC